MVVELDAGTDVWARGEDEWIVIPTNLQVRQDGEAVMGAGLARQAAERYPSLARQYGASLRDGRTRLAVHSFRLLLAPTKSKWREPADLTLLEGTIGAVAGWSRRHPDCRVLVPALGCGRGDLEWDDVRPMLQEGLAGCNVALVPPQG